MIKIRAASEAQKGLAGRREWRTQTIDGWPFVGREREAAQILDASILNWLERGQDGARFKVPLLAQKFGSGKTVLATHFHSIVSTSGVVSKLIEKNYGPEGLTIIQQLKSVSAAEIRLTFNSVDSLDKVISRIKDVLPCKLVRELGRDNFANQSADFWIRRYVTAVKHPVIFFLDDVQKDILVPLLCMIDSALRTQESPFFMFILATRITAVDDEAVSHCLLVLTGSCWTHSQSKSSRRSSQSCYSRNLNHYHHCPRLFSQIK